MKTGSEKQFGAGYNVLPIWKTSEAAINKSWKPGDIEKTQERP
jgi:hypothetical protein